MMLNFNSYEDLKDKLQIRIYDPDFSRNLLEGKVVTYIGDFALVYMATLYESEKKLGNLMFTPELMDALGIDIQTLHKDAMLSDLNYEPVLFTTEDLIEALFFDKPLFSINLFNRKARMGETAFASIRSALSGMNDLIDSDMDVTPTIRPVLDLTNVKAGAGKLNGLFTDPSFTPLANLRAIGNVSARNSQNGNSDEVVRAINRLGKSLNNVGNTYNSVNGVTYDNGSEVSKAVETLVRAITVGGRR